MEDGGVVGWWMVGWLDEWWGGGRMNGGVVEG